VRELAGIGASSGIAIGPARLIAAPIAVEERRIGAEGIGAELERFEAAVATTDAAMQQIAQSSAAPREVGSDLVETHRAILRSDEIVHETRALIRERSLGAEWAVRLVIEELRGVFATMQDERFRERFEDVEAVANRLLRTLLAVPEIRLEDLAGAVGIGVELSPLDALLLQRAGVAGVVTERGGSTSHSAIVARTLGIPYVFGVAGLLDLVRAGETVCVDGTRGDVVIGPDRETEVAFARRRIDAVERSRGVVAKRHEPAVTLDGTRVYVGANVESAGDVADAIEAGADHIGLVRTELLYLDRHELPSEEEQLHDAIQILDAAQGRMVTFRTLDIGGDKLPLGVRIAAGPNPALGLRGIRFSLRRLDVFRTQLRALGRAAEKGPLRIMFPLVSNAAEMHQARSIWGDVCAELGRQGIAHDPRVAVGAMIETPSAALTSDHIAAEADFLSIGTNDLVHYAFAADRQNDDVAYLYRPLHPAILRMLRHVIESATAHGREVSLCGDMAGEPRYTWILLGLGLRALSMVAREMALVKSIVRRSELQIAQELSHLALTLSSDVDVEALATERMASHLPPEIDHPH
jgi:phosphoenolpyruvate-protein phosphotransferase (PTS system enzyme I)